MILVHSAGTVGGITATAAAGVLGTQIHGTVVADVVIALAGSIGAFVAVLSYVTGRRSDPKQALIDHAGQDATNFGVVHDELAEIHTQLDTLVKHIIDTKE